MLKIVRTGAPSSNKTMIGTVRRSTRPKHSLLTRSLCKYADSHLHPVPGRQHKTYLAPRSRSDTDLNSSPCTVQVQIQEMCTHCWSYVRDETSIKLERPLHLIVVTKELLNIAHKKNQRFIFRGHLKTINST